MIRMIDAGIHTSAEPMLGITDNTAITYEGFGVRDAGIPHVEYDLGRPLSGIQVEGDYFLREFEQGKVELFMGAGDFPLPFEFRVTQNGQVLHWIGRTG